MSWVNCSAVCSSSGGSPFNLRRQSISFILKSMIKQVSIKTFLNTSNFTSFVHFANYTNPTDNVVNLIRCNFFISRATEIIVTWNLTAKWRSSILSKQIFQIMFLSIYLLRHKNNCLVVLLCDAERI